MRFAACCLLPALFAAALLGCGPSKPETYPVSGTVTWNGQPLPEGSIRFEPEDAKGLPPDPGQIKDGKYQLQARPGKKRVQIYATRESGKIDPIMGAAPREQYIPAKYNDKTELRAEVTPDGKNEFPFALVGDDAKPAKP
jgi:hypothetical protein